ncbi:MAG: sensor histidine kinase [Clostridiales Family XIII bacterium]|jgi:two-component system sensor histidine kinase YesM|nr:sensor histidine kinase [Clostridiales Family XIII bacterium]
MEKRRRIDYLSRRFWIFFICCFAALAAAVTLCWVMIARSGVAYAAGIALLCAYAFLLGWAYRFLWMPHRETERMLSLLSKGLTFEGIRSLPWQISPGTESVVEKFGEVLSSDEAINLTKRQAQYLAMQNQINPHFLYNTLEGIRGEALAGGNESIAKMTETLSHFFRYTISNLESLVTLEDELRNVNNYFTIQQYRFGDRLAMDVDFEDEEDRAKLLDAKVPKLILQPIVENAIIHGIEGAPGTGKIVIRIEFTGERLILTVSDNGVGMEPEKLWELNDRMTNLYERYSSGTKQGGIALSNVNSRIKLLFGEDYGIHIMSEIGTGTDVEVTLPYLTRYDEAPHA